MIEWPSWTHLIPTTAERVQAAASSLTLLAASAAAILAYRALRDNRAAALFAKSVDAINLVNQRYAELMRLRSRDGRSVSGGIPHAIARLNEQIGKVEGGAVKAPAKAGLVLARDTLVSLLQPRDDQDDRCREFYTLFWSLQADQFDLFLMGLIDPLTYATWTERKLAIFRSPHFAHGLSAWKGWLLYGRDAHRQDVMFVDLIETLFAFSTVRTHTGQPARDADFAWTQVGLFLERPYCREYRDVVFLNPSSKEPSRRLFGQRTFLQRLSRQDDPIKRIAKSKTSEIRRTRLDGTEVNFKKFPDPEKFSKVIRHEKEKILIPCVRKSISDYKIDRNPGRVRVLDFGCGTFEVGAGIQGDAEEVYGFDKDPDMIRVARNRNCGDHPWKIFSDKIDVLKADFDLILCIFVHQTAGEKRALRRLLTEAASALSRQGRLIIIGAHPDHMGDRFSAYEIERPPKGGYKEGAKIKGKIFGDDDDVYVLDDDRYWSIRAIQQACEDCGLMQVDEPENILDVPRATGATPASGHPYFKLTWERPPGAGS